MTSRDRVCDSRKGGTGGGGWVHPKGADSMAVSGLRFENTLVGSEWATAVLLCTNGLRKQSSCPARRPFPTGKHDTGPFFARLRYIFMCVHTYHVCNNYVMYTVAMRPYFSRLRQFRRLLCVAAMSSLPQLRLRDGYQEAEGT